VLLKLTIRLPQAETTGALNDATGPGLTLIVKVVSSVHAPVDTVSLTWKLPADE
jgi:hypothetical protein